MLQASNGGGSSDEVVFTMKVAADPNARQTFDSLRKEIEAIRREAQKPVVISVIGGGGAGAGSRPYSTSGSYGGGGGMSSFDQQWREKEAAIDAKLKQRQADIRDEVRRTNDALRDQVKLNAEFNSGMNRTVQGIGQMTSAFGMLSAAMGTDLKAAVQTVAAIEGGLSAMRGVKSVASGVSSMISTGGLAYTAGRAVGSVGGAALALGGGAALGYGITYAMGDDNSRRNLFGDVTETLGMHSRGADALAASASFADRVSMIGDRDRMMAGQDIRSRSEIAGYQFDTNITQRMNAGDTEGARGLMASRINSLRKPITSGGYKEMNETQRLQELKGALEDQQRLEQQIATTRVESAHKKLEWEQHATRELENQVRIEQDRLRVAEATAKGAKMNWADMSASERSRADDAVRQVQTQGFTDKQGERLLDMVAPELAEKSRLIRGVSFDHSEAGKFRAKQVEGLQSGLGDIRGMVGDQRLDEKAAADNLAAIDTELASKQVEVRQALAQVMAMIAADLRANMLEETKRLINQSKP
jgi:hypothetical protein